GNVVERFVYDPYGQPTVLTAGWGVRGVSSYDWQYLHQGGRYDTMTGLYSFRHRDLSPSLGRWIESDPIGFRAGDGNLYRYLFDNTTTGLDPYGLDDPRSALGPPRDPPPIIIEPDRSLA